MVFLGNNATLKLKITNWQTKVYDNQNWSLVLGVSTNRILGEKMNRFFCSEVQRWPNLDWTAPNYTKYDI